MLGRYPDEHIADLDAGWCSFKQNGLKSARIVCFRNQNASHKQSLTAKQLPPHLMRIFQVRHM